jgi:hypothetical protein
VAIDTPGGNLILKIKSRAQQITLKPNIIKVKKLLANVSLFTVTSSEQSKRIYRVWYIYLQNNGLIILQKLLHSLKEQMNRKKGKHDLSVTSY